MSESFEETARRTLDRYIVPQGDARDALVELGVRIDRRPEGRDLLVLVAAFRAAREAIADVYRPRSPLEAQLEFDRAREELRQEGVNVPAWNASEDAPTLERWARWVADGSADS